MPWIEDQKYAEYRRKLSQKTPKGIEIIVEAVLSSSVLL
jgi:NADPH-dependent curcumin reductase CurA